MLLDELIEVIDTLKQRISDHGPTLKENEIRTRMALIDPLLQVLGWDTSDPSLVSPEYNASGGKADYALLNQGGRPAAAIEAKRLGQPLQQHLAQMVTYATMAGIAYAGITDGDQWELYDVFHPSALKNKQLLNLRISASSSYQCALNLLLLWRPNLSSNQLQEASKPIAFPHPAADPLPPPDSPDPKEWILLSEFDAIKSQHAPSRIRFPDGSEVQIQQWYDLVVQTIGWLWSMKILTTGDILRFSTKKRYLFHTQAVHPSGKPFFSPKTVSKTPLIVEANLSKIDSLKKVKALLKHFSQDSVYVQIESNGK